MNNDGTLGPAFGAECVPAPHASAPSGADAAASEAAELAAVFVRLERALGALTDVNQRLGEGVVGLASVLTSTLAELDAIVGWEKIPADGSHECRGQVSAVSAPSSADVDGCSDAERGMPVAA